MIQRIQKAAQTALFIDIVMHLVIFKPMASRINTVGIENVSWWSRWAYKILFTGHGYPAMALDPAARFFGDSLIGMYIAPYFFLLLTVLFWSFLKKPFLFCFNLVINVTRRLVAIILHWLDKLVTMFLPIIKKKMNWFKKQFFALINYKPKNDTSRGSSGYGTPRERRKLFNKRHSGLLINGTCRIKRNLSMRHLAVIAPSGQGKTTNYVIPNVLGLPEFKNPKTGLPASMVITDPKGEIYDLTAQYLKKEGYTIKVIEVDNPQHSGHFNPLQRANTDKELAKVAQILIDSGLNEGKTGDFWGNAAKMMLTTILKIVKRSAVPKEHQNLHNVIRFVDLMGGDGKPLLEYVAQYCTDPNAITKYTSFVQQEAETISNILLTIKAALKDLSVNEICQLTKDDTLDFEKLRSEKTVLYIITPFSDIEYYRFILTLLYSQIFSFCDKVEKGNDIVFMLDEFGNLGKIPAFTQLITTLRSKGCSISIILQDMEQLRMVYGKSGASTIFNGGCSSKIFFGGIQNLETLQDISKMLGTQTLQQKNSEGKELTPIARPLKLPDEISKMKIGTGLFLSAGEPPFEISMKQYEDTRLKKRVQFDEQKNLVIVPKPLHPDTPIIYFEFDRNDHPVLQE